MLRVRVCPDCGKLAKTGSAFTRHINRCPVALGLSNRKKVRDPQGIGKDEDKTRKDSALDGWSGALDGWGGDNQPEVSGPAT